MRDIQSSEQWAQAQVAGFPARWRKRLLGEWEKKAKPRWESYTHGGVRRWYVSADDGMHNRELREIVERLSKVKLSLDADDAEVTAKAEELAVHCMDVGRIQIGAEAVRRGMEEFCRGVGVEPPAQKVEDRPAINRMTCRDWWRRGLRKLHAKAVEGAAIQLGYVNKARDLYVSNESLARRAQQLRRNRRMLESTLMRNEDGQEFTLAELAARGVANKAIRRGELMTRIAGFEKIAVECGHGGAFITPTCPSRMHKWNRGEGGRVYANDKYDGTTPREAQKYLSKCWARVRAKLAREGAKLYGFRIAEPHHDGCPHWHVLVFHEIAWRGDERRKAYPRIIAIFRRYFLADSHDENGARKYRLSHMPIDWKKGTAAGYIAKYVAKNIDGLHVGEDLFGNPAMETSQRVEAWASTWGIRQFQQIGGAPVGVWRELRRVKELPDDAPAHLRAAHDAVNRVDADICRGGAGGRSAVGRDTGRAGCESEAAQADGKRADWAAYCKAQGGVFVGRNAAIKIATEQTGEVGRYGEMVAPKPMGVVTMGLKSVMVCARMGLKLVEWVVKSARKVWEVVRRAGRSPDPRTRVNNCTPPGSEVFEAVGCFST